MNNINIASSWPILVHKAVLPTPHFNEAHLKLQSYKKSTWKYCNKVKK